MKQQVSIQMGDGHIVSEGNQIPQNYDYFVFQELEQSFVIENNSLDKHYDHVMSSLGNYYKGVNKFVYGNTIAAIKTIVTCKKQHARRTESCKEAIAFLHQNMAMASNSIKQTLLLFGVKLSTRQILRDSEQVFSSKSTPKWISFFEENPSSEWLDEIYGGDQL